GDTTGIAVDNSGTVYIATSKAIRKVTSDGIIHTVATGVRERPDDNASPLQPFGALMGLALDAAGNLYAADYERNCIYKITAARVEIVAGAGRPNERPGSNAAP